MVMSDRNGDETSLKVSFKAEWFEARRIAGSGVSPFKLEAGQFMARTAPSQRGSGQYRER
jgi:hypothetical protein